MLWSIFTQANIYSFFNNHAFFFFPLLGSLGAPWQHTASHRSVLVLKDTSGLREDTWIVGGDMVVRGVCSVGHLEHTKWVNVSRRCLWDIPIDKANINNIFKIVPLT